MRGIDLKAIKTLTAVSKISAMPKKILFPAGTAVAALALGGFVQLSEKLDHSVPAPAVVSQVALPVDPPVPPSPNPTEIAAKRFDVTEVTPVKADLQAPDRGAGRDALPKLPHAPAAALGLPPLKTPPKDLSGRIEALEPEGWTSAAPADGLDQYGLSCEPAITATPAPGAMIDLHLAGFCGDAAGPVEVIQNRLRFSVDPGETGTLSLRLPALDANPVIVVATASNKVFTTALAIPEAAEFTRLVLLSEAGAGLHLHAFADGAGYDDPGHVWAAQPNGAKGLSLSQLGEGALVAEVLSLPAQDALPRIDLEAEISQANCAAPITGEILRPDADGTFRTDPVVIEAPGCDGEGGFLLLKNILAGPKLARN